jgi:hypothetical protein
MTSSLKISEGLECAFGLGFRVYFKDLDEQGFNGI